MGISLWPFLKREMATLMRDYKVFATRTLIVVVAGAYLAGLKVYWDWNGWDRATIQGSRVFGQVVFYLIGTAAFSEYRQLVSKLASSFGSERDRKSLDALLTSRFSSIEIVLGTVSAGLFRFANATLAIIPFVLLMVFLGAVEPTTAALAACWVVSSSLLLAGISVAVSVGSRTASNAVFAAWGLVATWMIVPPLYVFLRPQLWSAAPDWLNSAMVVVFDGSPMGFWMVLLGISPRTGGPSEAIGQAIGWQVLVSLTLVAWAALRLRPASRSLADGWEQGRVGRIRAALRRSARHRPCGDDAMVWLEVQVGRPVGLARRLAIRVSTLVLLVAFGFLAWNVAGPAFRELVERGYRPSPEASAIRFADFQGSTPFDPQPGLARFWLNLLIRLATMLTVLLSIILIQFSPLESVRTDRKRDTWSGLLATPLSGREILRGKALGAIWKARKGLLFLVLLWVVGLACGAIHPTGFLASITTLAVLSASATSAGLNIALIDCKAKTPGSLSVASAPSRGVIRTILAVLILLVVGTILMITAIVIYLVLILVLMLGPPLSYEDVFAILRGGPVPEFGDLSVSRWIGARSVVLAWLIGMSVLAIWAAFGWRSSLRRFDEFVGRPFRLPPGPEADRIESLRRERHESSTHDRGETAQAVSV